jgi:hypothetical protein
MKRSLVRPPGQGVAYCATCDKEFGKTNDSQIGIRFACPVETSEGEEHIAAVVKGSSGKFWLRREQDVLKYELVYSPLSWFGCWKGLFEGRTGWYVLARFGVLIVSLLVARSSCWFRFIPFIIAIIAIADILLANTSAAFFAWKPTHPLRSIILATFSFAQLVIAFSIFYAILASNFNPPLDTFDAVYFSFVTITTLGYGDILPKTLLPQFVVILELVAGLYFIVVIIGIISTWPKKPFEGSATKLLQDVLKSGQ